MSKPENSAKGQKSFGVTIYEPLCMCTRVTCPDGHLFRRVEIFLPYVLFCERFRGEIPLFLLDYLLALFQGFNVI